MDCIFKYKTEHQIGKITYLVETSYREDATDTLGERVEKLVLRDLDQCDFQSDSGKEAI